MTIALERAWQHAVDWQSGLDRRSIAVTVDLDTLRQRIDGGLPETGSGPKRSSTN